MTRLFIRQVCIVPPLALAAILLVGVITPGYSSMTQHISELGIMPGLPGIVMPTGAIIAGLSIVLFGFAVAFLAKDRMPWTGLAAALFGVSYASGGFFPMGDARHGLYGLTMCYVLVPAFFAAEASERLRTRSLIHISLLASFLSLSYMWLLLSGFEPPSVRGLTARLAVVVIFGWYVFAGLALLRKADQPIEGHRPERP